MDHEPSEASKGRASMASQRIAVEDFTQVAFEGVLRAIEARNREDFRLPYGPIIYGIVWDPEFQVREVFGPQSGSPGQ